MKRIKIIKKVNEEKTSCIVPSEAGVVYKEHQWATAPEWLQKAGYHLLVFNNVEDALSFTTDIFDSDIYGDIELWTCKVRGKIRRLPEHCYFFVLDERQLCGSGKDWPEGTEMYKKVKLVKRIYQI
jgi:hypothetical protein